MIQVNQQALGTINPSQNRVRDTQEHSSNPVNVIQNSIPFLSEQGQQAKRKLEILAATGKTKAIKDEDKLYQDLRNDYILMNKLDRWVGYLCLKMGSLTALASTSLITMGNCIDGKRGALQNDTKSAKTLFKSFCKKVGF
jgi:hypothetical protein